MNVKLVPSDIGFSRPLRGPAIKAIECFRPHKALLTEPRSVESLASLIDDYVVTAYAGSIPIGVDRE